MVVHEKNLPEIINVSTALQYWQDVIARVQTLPLVHGMWTEGEGEGAKTCFANEALMMTPQEFHGLMVAGVITHATKQIADLRVKLNRMGVSTDNLPVALTPPADVLKLTDQTVPGASAVPPVPVRKKRSRR